MMAAALLFSLAAIIILAIAAKQEFSTPGNGIVMKAEGDGGSGSDGDSGGWDFSNDDLPF